MFLHVSVEALDRCSAFAQQRLRGWRLPPFAPGIDQLLLVAAADQTTFRAARALVFQRATLAMFRRATEKIQRHWLRPSAFLFVGPQRLQTRPPRAVISLLGGMPGKLLLRDLRAWFFLGV